MLLEPPASWPVVWACSLGERDLPVYKHAPTAEPAHTLPRKGIYVIPRHGGSGTTTRAGFRSALRKAFLPFVPEVPIDFPVHLFLMQVAGMMRQSGPTAGLPWIDSDACIWAVKDSLQPEKRPKPTKRPRKPMPTVLVEDGLVVTHTVASSYRDGEIGLEVVLYRVLPDPRVAVKKRKGRRKPTTNGGAG